MKKIKCTGIHGYVFGHNYEAVYDIQKELRTPEETKKVLDAVSDFNGWHFQRIIPNIDQPKAITKVYIGHVCKRCGHTIKLNTNVI